MIAKLPSKIRNVVRAFNTGLSQTISRHHNRVGLQHCVKTDGLRCIAKFVRIRRPRNSKTSRGIRYRAASCMKDRDCFQHKYRGLRKSVIASS